LSREKIRYILVDEGEYRRWLGASRQPVKPWRVSHSKEAGIITCFVSTNPYLFQTPHLQYTLLFLHYFYETAYASRFYKTIADTHPKSLGKEVVNSITNHADAFSFFHPNAYSENLFWKKAEELFHNSYSIKDAKFFSDSAACSEYASSPRREESVVSLNIVDHIWNSNFSGQDTIMPSSQPNQASFLYHARQALWQNILNDLTGLTEEEMDTVIIQNLGLGDVAFTNKVISDTLRS